MSQVSEAVMVVEPMVFDREYSLTVDCSRYTPESFAKQRSIGGLYQGERLSGQIRFDFKLLCTNKWLTDEGVVQWARTVGGIGIGALSGQLVLPLLAQYPGIAKLATYSEERVRAPGSKLRQPEPLQLVIFPSGYWVNPCSGQRVRVSLFSDQGRACIGQSPAGPAFQWPPGQVVPVVVRQEQLR